MQVVVDGARVRFGSRVVFSDFSATIAAHSLTALAGPSGSGKSTLLSAIAGLHPLTQGDISYRTQDVTIYPDPALVTFIPQGANALRGRTAVDNVMIGALSEGAPQSKARAGALRALAEVGLAGRARDVARQLSGGELQRLAFARGVASERPLIIADEPSASLDEANTRTIAELLRSLRGRATVIVATHDPVLMEAAEYVVTLRPGTA